MKKDFLKIIVLYTLGVAAVLYLMWILLQVALPEAHLDIVRALSSAFGINLPDEIFVSTGSGLRAVAVILIISLLSICLIIFNVFFGAIITTNFIRPRVNMVTSTRGVLSQRWNPGMPYVLVRLSNFHKYELADVRLSVVITVEETHKTESGADDKFMCFLHVEDFTPQRILVMRQKMPWSIAVPADTLLNSSMTRNYHFKPGEPITRSYRTGKKFVEARRTLEVLIQGLDLNSYSEFVMHKTIKIDEQKGDDYILHLHPGAFKSLPLEITDASELEQYVD